MRRSVLQRREGWDKVHDRHLEAPRARALFWIVWGDEVPMRDLAARRERRKFILEGGLHMIVGRPPEEVLVVCPCCLKVWHAVGG